MDATGRKASGRPLEGEYAAYAKVDIDRVQGDDAVGALTSQLRGTLALLGAIPEGAASHRPYAPGKWTLKEVVGHMTDDERIFTYRALCVARNDTAPLPGFDEKEYVAHASFEARPLADVLAEYESVRKATLSFAASLTPEEWLRYGTVNGYRASVRGLVFHLAGHELHHLAIVRERYLNRP